MTIKLPKGGLDKSLRYYLAGPMSNYPEYNYPLFGRVQAELQDLGLDIESPHTNPWPEEMKRVPDMRRSDDPKPGNNEELWQFMMRSALRQLLACNAIILLKGWSDSRGAVVEANIATALKMPMYFLDGEYLVAMHDRENGQ